jgi:hypothetical protein
LGEWKLLHRQPIFEKDRIDPIDPAAAPRLDTVRLASFPEGYRHLAYIQTGIGYEVKLDMPMLEGPVVEGLYRRGARWLVGGVLDRSAGNATVRGHQRIQRARSIALRCPLLQAARELCREITHPPLANLRVQSAKAARQMVLMLKTHCTTTAPRTLL